MKEHIIYKYEAFDGTMFDNKDECKKYESAERNKTLTVVLLDYKWSRLELNADGIADAYVIICNSLEDVAFIKKLGDEAGVSHPFECYHGNCDEKIGIYFFDDIRNRWVNFDEEFKEIQENYWRCLAYRQ